MAAVNLSWFPPSASWITDLAVVINGTGTQGFRFNGSGLPELGQYSYCNMEHVRPQNYQVPSMDKYQLVYVELVHRHHKRSPYAANGFPKEIYPWNCTDEGLIYSSQLLCPGSHSSTNTYWSVYISPSNPFQPPGLYGSCQFPQITSGGLDDSYQHGQDLAAVYRDQLDFIPANPDGSVSFRVTNNVITSQVASMLIAGMFPATAHNSFPLLIQPAAIDSLEPAYTCAPATALYGTFGPNSNNSVWQSHISAAKSLWATLDSISGVNPSDSGFHMSMDHYFDNLSSRQCHAMPLPCSASNSSACVTQAMADSVYRIGQWEYSWQYRGSDRSVEAAVGAYGVWFAELAQNLRDSVAGQSIVKYRHNIAHDGSVSKILAILQVDNMVWPGMGSEVVFELYKVIATGKYALRILWGGIVLKSSNPTLGSVDMLDLDTFLAYIDGLVGLNASKVAEYCNKK
ncbi:phosphoglycerate mutase-like protein [Microthyrium microscopicum]|uniref:Phosphoglycerate mutase-like protein n=1 Tax=Microthyrium microscopicum TaxID=703497 RepID=A0A6A6UPE2_9PEZI|nr:phosphoglycerate mutase-like protein [Microthyrium microscopicum]